MLLPPVASETSPTAMLPDWNSHVAAAAPVVSRSDQPVSQHGPCSTGLPAAVLETGIARAVSPVMISASSDTGYPSIARMSVTLTAPDAALSVWNTLVAPLLLAAMIGMNGRPVRREMR